jgi:hypothetical protein
MLTTLLPTTLPTTQPSALVTPAFLASTAAISVANDYLVGLIKPYLPAKTPVAVVAAVIASVGVALAVFVFHSIQGDPISLIVSMFGSTYAAYRAHTDFGPLGSLTQTTASSVANDEPATKAASKTP